MDFFKRKLDDKNRLTIPKELREEFGSEVVITQGFKNYLHLYPVAVWNNEMEAALQGNILDEHIADRAADGTCDAHFGAQILTGEG